MDERHSVEGPAAAGDGFRSAEVNATIDATLHAWKPRVHYEDVQISKLVPGSAPVCLLGRLINFYDQPTPGRMPYAAKGCLKVLMKDDTGVMTIRLWYAMVDYELRLGQLVSLWTSHVSPNAIAGCGPWTHQSASYMTTIFPERDNSCCFMVQADKDMGTLFKKPLGCTNGKQLAGLINLRSFVDGGHDGANGRVLVCVKSIGGRKKGEKLVLDNFPSNADPYCVVTTEQGSWLDIVLVNVFDDTSEATLSLCGRVAKSAASWKSSHTILLLSNLGFRAGKKPTLCVNSRTHIDVDPCMTDAEWLRAFAQRLTTREAVNIPFPEGARDLHGLPQRPGARNEPHDHAPAK
ncbi:MAG: hypothetical protein Q9211_005556 [Gyalolechia sp. 1 TL-2023]